MSKKEIKWRCVLALLSGICLFGVGCSGNGAEPVESWPLNDGGTGTVIASELKGGSAGENKWGVWLNNDTFGRVLDFSTQGSNMYVRDSRLNLGKEFAISLWAMAPPREENDRVLLMQGTFTDAAARLDGFRLFLDGTWDHELRFEASGMTIDGGSGVALADGLWHHILVSCKGGKLTYYIDGEEKATVAASGKISAGSKDLFIGSDTAGENGFDGSMAEVRIFDSAKTPAEATQTVLKASDNEAKALRLPIKKGIALDRRQYAQPEPLPSEGQTVTKDDIINCMNMGFDHVKLLLTPNHLINDDGSLKTENMEYITRVVDYVKELDYRCILCLHPEGDFKMFYLKNLENFETLLHWYGEFAKYVGEHWEADTVAIQLMTEPGENNMTVSWSWMSDRMWGAVRNVLPDHTILTSSDRYGNLEQLKYMSPASDPNLVYTFTTYEPYTIGWYYYNTNYGEMNAWSYIHDIPYPVEEGVDYTDAIENAIDQVPDSLKEGIRQELWAYVRGEYDGKRTDMPNHYDSLYNAEWHMLRAKSLDDWRQRYGGNIRIMCVEFGCMDAATPAVLWHSAAPSYGISDAKRLEFTRDMRASFDAYDIGWDYWSYNEAHTIFKTSAHAYGTSPAPEVAANMFDYEMLTEGLGLTPLVSEDGAGGAVELDPEWLSISTFESIGSWYGSGLELHYDGAPSGYTYLASTQRDEAGSCVFATALSPKLDASAYTQGYAHIWIYVEDADKLVGGQLELCSGGGPDMYETSWELAKYITHSGWNELYLPFENADSGNKPADLSALDYIRLYLILNGDTLTGLDNFYLCNEKQEVPDDAPAIGGSEYTLDAIEELGGWIGTEVSMQTTDAPAGKQWLAAKGVDAAGSAVFACGFRPANLSSFADGKLELWVYIEDISKLTGGQIELTSSGDPDQEETSWNVFDYVTQNGWTKLSLPLSEANAVGGGADLSRICYMRIYFTLTEKALVGIDEIKLVK